MLLLTISEIAPGATPAEASEALPRLVVQINRDLCLRIFAIVTEALAREAGPDDPLLEWEEDDA